MPRIASIEVINESSIKIILPDHMKVTPGSAVPPELLEIIALQIKVGGSLGNEADCGVQFN